MVNTLNRVFGAITIFLCFSIAQVELQVLDNGNITYTSTSDIAGLQFDHNGCADGAQNDTGGLFSSLTVSATSVIGFDMEGGVLPAGSGNLASGTSCSASDISNFVFAGPVCSPDSSDYENPTGNPGAGNCGAAGEGQAAALSVTAVDALAPCDDIGLYVAATVFPPPGSPAYTIPCTGSGSLLEYYTCDQDMGGGTLVSDLCPASCNACPSPAVPVTGCDASAEVCLAINSDGDIVVTSTSDIYGWQIAHGSCNTSSTSAGDDWDGDGDTFSTTINNGIFLYSLILHFFSFVVIVPRT